MNIYLIGIIVSLIVFFVISLMVSRKVQSAEDFYVAGRKAPVLLISGSMIASLLSTGLFTGDVATCYEGAFAPLILLCALESAGYIIGAVFFGIYLRRSGVMTIPEFFGKRFDSELVRKISAVISIITMTVYLLSVIQGVGTLMSYVTKLNYNVCLIISALAFTFISVVSGSRGVLITDTLMASLFTLAMVVGAFFIAKRAGGWYETISSMAANPATADYLSWRGKPGALFDSGAENLIWSLVYSVVWMSVCMIGPWQSSRYQMAKNEAVIIRSASYSAVGVFAVCFVAEIAAVMVVKVNPNLEQSSHVLIWASMNMMPKVLGVVLLTGILSAGVSSGTTFLSLIGASFANDLIRADEKKTISVSRVIMIIVSIFTLLLAVSNSPAIFWIEYMGGAIIACSWMPVCLAAVFSKRITKAGALAGMIVGFLTCFGMKMSTALFDISFPAYFDPSLVGIVVNIIAIIVVSSFTKVTENERAFQKSLFVRPESEKDPLVMKKTLSSTKWNILVGPIIALIMFFGWVLPYLMGKK